MYNFVSVTLLKCNLCYAEAVGSCLGELGPINFSTIAIQHNKDASYTKAFELLEDKDLRWTLIMVTHLNNTLVEDWYVLMVECWITLYLPFMESNSSHEFIFLIVKTVFCRLFKNLKYFNKNVYYYYYHIIITPSMFWQGPN